MDAFIRGLNSGKLRQLTRVTEVLDECFFNSLRNRDLIEVFEENLPQDILSLEMVSKMMATLKKHAIKVLVSREPLEGDHLAKLSVDLATNIPRILIDPSEVRKGLVNALIYITHEFSHYSRWVHDTSHKYIAKAGMSRREFVSANYEMLMMDEALARLDELECVEDLLRLGYQLDSTVIAEAGVMRTFIDAKSRELPELDEIELALEYLGALCLHSESGAFYDAQIRDYLSLAFDIEQLLGRPIEQLHGQTDMQRQIELGKILPVPVKLISRYAQLALKIKDLIKLKRSRHKLESINFYKVDFNAIDLDTFGWEEFLALPRY